MTKYFLFIALLLVAACNHDHQSINKTDCYKSGFQIYHLNVGEVSILDTNNDQQHNNREESLALQKNLEKWAKDHIKSVADNKSKFKIIIEKAIFSKKPQQKNQEGIKDLFHDDQIILQAEIEVKFEFYDEDDLLLPKYEMRISSNSTTSLDSNNSLKNMSLVVRELLSSTSICNFSTEFENNFDKYFHNILRID